MYDAVHGKSKNLNQSYENQIQRSISRGHSFPSYTRTEFKLWALSDVEYNKIYSAWVASGCEKDLAPSIDRLDETKGYSFDNVQWVTSDQNVSNYTHKISTGEARPHNSKYVAQYSKSGDHIASYVSVQEAGRRTLGWFQNISKVCRGSQLSSGGYKWKYISEKEYQNWVVPRIIKAYEASTSLEDLEAQYSICVQNLISILHEHKIQKQSRDYR